jgi:ADP-ribose pyrophosphatase YjhB (NUDIX family)
MKSFRFCPYCGIELAARRNPGEEIELPTCAKCGFIAYRNAKPCAGALVVKDGRVLLVKRAQAPFAGWWDVPGGYLEYDEHPEDAARRELREETGYEIRITGLVGVYPSQYDPEGQRTLDLIYLAEIVSGEERPASDALEIGWFAPDELPAEVAFDSGPASLRDWARTLGSGAR